MVDGVLRWPKVTFLRLLAASGLFMVVGVTELVGAIGGHRGRLIGLFAAMYYIVLLWIPRSALERIGRDSGGA